MTTDSEVTLFPQTLTEKRTGMTAGVSAGPFQTKARSDAVGAASMRLTVMCSSQERETSAGGGARPE